MSCKETLKELLTTTIDFVLPYFIVLICLYLIIFWYDIVVAAENYPDNHKLVCEQADPVATYPLGSAAIARLLLEVLQTDKPTCIRPCFVMVEGRKAV